MEVLVEFEYQALHDDELSLQPGDVIVGVRRVEEEGWMEGELRGRRGLFPDNFVKELKKDGKEAEVKAEVKAESKAESCQPQRREKPAGTVAHLVQRMSIIGVPTGGFQPSTQTSTSRKKPKRRQCKVLFDYTPQNQDELELKVGELVDITEEVEQGWWNGSVNGKSGLFPSNFVKELEEEDTSEVTVATDETDGKEVSSPTSPGSVAGNGGVAQPKKVLGFGFGDIFREGSVKLRPRPPSPAPEERKNKPIPSLPSAAKPGHAPPSDPPANTAEYYKVTFTFESTHEDELSLKEGDLIHVLSKDTGEPGWWRGRVNGREGVFPDNFVTVVTDADKEPQPTGTKPSLTSLKPDVDEKPKKPPPPSKHPALRPEVPNTDRKPQSARSEDKVEYKPSKPAAPLVSKKPLPPPGRGRLSGAPPRRPDKPLTPSPAPPTSARHNGEVSSGRPKSDLEPPVTPKPKTVSGDGAEKSLDKDLMSFDALSTSSEKLSHLTANRPKMLGRRLPGLTHGHTPNNKEVEEEQEEEEEAKPRLADTKKPSMSSVSVSPAVFLRPSSEAPGGVSPLACSPAGEAPSLGSGAQPEGAELAAQLEDMRSTMRELLSSVELIKTQQTKEMALLRADLDEERMKRLSLQMEIEKLKQAVQST